MPILIKTPSLLLSALALFLLGLFTFSFNTNNKKVSASGCGGGLFLNVYDDDPTNTDLSGTVIFGIGIPSGVLPPIRVVIEANGQKIGQAKPDSSSSYSWSMMTPSSLLNPGSVDFLAKADFIDGSDCGSNNVQKQIIPMGSSDFSLVINRPDIITPVNTNVSVSASINIPGIGTDFSKYAIYDWEATGVGNVTDTINRQTQFFSGPSAGDGVLEVDATYGVHNRSVAVPVNVSIAGSPLPPTTTQQTDSTSRNNDTEGSTQLSNPSTNETSVEDDPEIRSCLSDALGQEEFDRINNGQKRPKVDDLIKARACFAKTSYIIPSNFAPVNPSEVNRLPVSSEIRINQVESSDKEVNNTRVSTLVFSGQAKPNSAVFIYIFSEPIVLTVSANDSGEWLYELENPLEPGEHTAYAVVDRGDGVYEKTDPFSFVIGTAEASAANPNGLSLDLQESTRATATQSNRATTLYLVSSLTALVLAGLIALIIVKKKKLTFWHKEKAQNNAILGPNQNVNSDSTAPVSTAVDSSQNTNESTSHQSVDAVQPSVDNKNTNEKINS